jgi:hypothetical protein
MWRSLNLTVTSLHKNFHRLVKSPVLCFGLSVLFRLDSQSRLIELANRELSSGIMSAYKAVILISECPSCF